MNARFEKTQDWRLVRSLAEEIWREYYPAILAGEQIEYMLELRYSEAALAADDAQGVECWLVVQGGGPQGFIGLGRDGSDIKLHKLYLRASARGLGLGASALSFVEQRARALGGRRLVLNVHKQNARAIRAYERAGFSRCSSEMIPIGHGFVLDDYIYEKAL